MTLVHWSDQHGWENLLISKIVKLISLIFFWVLGNVCLLEQMFGCITYTKLFW